MEDTVKKTFRISKKSSSELDFIRNYHNKSFGDTLEIIISHARLAIDEKVNIKVKDELKETTTQISFEYQKLRMAIDGIEKEIQNIQRSITEGDEQNYKRIVDIRKFINLSRDKE